MDRLVFEDSGWYRALTLTERAALLHRAGPTAPQVDVQHDLATRRVERWHSQPPFTNASILAQRLATVGLNEDEFAAVLGEPIEVVRNRVATPPLWLTQLAATFTRPTPTGPIPLPEALRRERAAGFLEVITPLLRPALDRVREGGQSLVEGYGDVPFDPATIVEIQYAHLARRCLARLSRTMVLELNVALLEGLLDGETPEDRFQSFVALVREPERALAILQEYPVLARQLAICGNQWVTSSVELLDRLAADWTLLRSTFSPHEDPGLIVETTAAGDSHREGRTVQTIRFSSGLQLVYKPRPMSLDVHFQELFTWLNDRGHEPPFRILKVLDRGTHGWTEFVTARGCSSNEEVERFYQRQGAHLALLYALEATDFHMENVIAAGEHPILIDLEALFHPRTFDAEPDKAEALALNIIAHTVLRVGLLPHRIWAGAESEGVEISGLGGAPGQLTPQAVLTPEQVGTDEMHFTRQRMEMSGSHNRPSLNGADVDVRDYVDSIVSGFTSVYRLLLRHRDELLSDDGPLACFGDDEVRVILRATRTYGMLLLESFHPDVLRDALDRDLLLDRLWLAVESSPPLARAVAAEQVDLQKGDIPLFTTRPASRDLWTSSNERIPDFFDDSGLALARRRLERLSDRDLELQLWTIRASMACLAEDAEPIDRPARVAAKSGDAARRAPPGEETPVDREELLQAARAIGDRLESLALRVRDDVSWIGVSRADERHFAIFPLAMDFYDGLPGVALFLAYLGAITKDDRYTNLARAASTTIRENVRELQSSTTWIGGFVGWGGILYALTHLGILWEDAELLGDAEHIVESLPALIEQDENLDIIAGAAGCIGSLLSLHAVRPSDATCAAAIRCGDHLIARGQTMEAGIGWLTLRMTKALTGFAHGTAGIGWSLLKLTALTGEERFRAAARSAITYERSLFSPEDGNWADLREVPRRGSRSGQTGFMTAWCHGAPGIGLARLSTLDELDDTEVRREIDTALTTTLARGFGHNHSLCHGDTGNLELLLAASRIFNQPDWHVRARQIAQNIVSSVRRKAWICGTPLSVESPGLMTGLAGIGYGLLRLAEPARVPSVLLLAPPRAHKGS